METLILALRNLGPVRLAIMGAVMLGMIGFFIFLATRLATPSMVLLYGDLNAVCYVDRSISNNVLATNTITKIHPEYPVQYWVVQTVDHAPKQDQTDVGAWSQIAFSTFKKWVVFVCD